MENNNHFNKIFWLLAIALGLAFVYIFLITFVTIPKENIRFADTAQGFMLGTVVAGIIGYFAGGSPPVKKSDETTVKAETVNAENVENLTTTTTNLNP